MEENESFDLRLLWLLLIPGVLVAAVLTRAFIAHPDDDSHSAATRNLSVSVPAQVGRCAVPTADQLTQQSYAVEAKATAATASTARLRVTRVLAGSQVGEITVKLPAAGTTDAMVPTFTAGGSYLLAVSSDGTLAGCGLSGKDTGDLRDLYTKAFG